MGENTEKITVFVLFTKILFWFTPQRCCCSKISFCIEHREQYWAIDYHGSKMYAVFRQTRLAPPWVGICLLRWRIWFLDARESSQIIWNEFEFQCLALIIFLASAPFRRFKQMDDKRFELNSKLVLRKKTSLLRPLQSTGESRNNASWRISAFDRRC